jgi:hypothetical protein
MKRNREGAGKSVHSWIKHDFIKKAAGAQVAAFRQKFPHAQIILIDGNAGDGAGVEMQQRDMFVRSCESEPTPQVLADLAATYHATLCLCEHDVGKRRMLKARFPDVRIVPDQAAAADLALRGFNYALWTSDPCGPKGHGLYSMSRIALGLLRSDFIVVSNEGALSRFIGVAHCPSWQKHQVYTLQLDPAWWLAQLPKRYLARSPLINQSQNFHFRLLVISDFLTEGVRRMRNVEIIERSNGGGHGQPSQLFRISDEHRR